MERIKEALERAKAERAKTDATLGPDAASPASSEPVARVTPRTTEAKPPQLPVSQPPQAAMAAMQSRPPAASELTSREVVTLDPRHLERHRIVAHQKHNPNSGTFDLLRTQVLHKMSKNGWNTVGVVSPAPGAGKTVVAINLALSIAQLRDRTSMLLDFDLRRPSVLKYLGLDCDVSLNDVLENHADFGEALVSPLLPRFSVAAASRPVAHSAELLSSNRLAELISEVKGRYADRTVVVDLPPILNADDALAVMPNLDCILVVIGSGMSSRSDVEETLRYLPTSNLLGTVLNKAKTVSNDYSYGY